MRYIVAHDKRASFHLLEDIELPPPRDGKTEDDGWKQESGEGMQPRIQIALTTKLPAGTLVGEEAILDAHNGCPIVVAVELGAA